MQLRRPSASLADEAHRVAVVDHHHRVVLVRQFTDLVQLGDIAVHGEDAVGRDQSIAHGLGFPQLRLQVGHVVVAIAETLGLAKTHAINDARVIQLIGDDRILGAKQRFEQAAIGVEAGRVEDRIVHPQESTDGLF